MGFFDFFRRNKETQNQASQPHSNNEVKERWTQKITLDTIFRKSISFHAERFEEWQAGQCINKGDLDFDIHLIANDGKISVNIPNATRFRMHKTVDFDFAGSEILGDRIQYINNPGQSTDSTLPIILHVFVKNGVIDYIRFAMSYPDRLIELYGYQIISDTSNPDNFVEKIDSEARKHAGVEREKDKLTQSINCNSPIKSKVDDAIRIFELGNIPLLQQRLYELVICLNKRGTGRLITSYPEKDKLCEVFHLCLRFDWMHDNDIREVWAENAFYCVTKYYEEIQTNAMNRQDLVVAALDLFLTCIYGESSLYPKFNNILRKAYNHPIHYSYFSEANYTGGAKHLVREFKCFAATILAPIEKTYPQIISSSIRAEFENAKSDSEFLNISSEETLRKMKLMSDIFESILNDV